MKTFQSRAAMDDPQLEIRYLRGPLDSAVVPWGAVDAIGIWHVGGVYRYSPDAETYTWREIHNHVR